MPPIERGEAQDGAGEPDGLEGKRGAGYWRRLTELATREERLLCSDGDSQTISRRNLLKLLGASMALAGLPGCTREPREVLVPYVEQPEQLVPGLPRYYASAAFVGGYAHGVLAESHEGRPIKLEGNPHHPASLGACDAISQASVLSLYDPDRSASVRNRGEIASYGDFQRELGDRRQQWNARRGGGLAFVSGTVASPSQRARIDALRERWPQARWFVHEPVDREGVFAGSEMLFGRALEPRYRFDRVAVAVSLDADFMQAQPGFLRYARDFTARRSPRLGKDAPGAKKLARLYALESTPSVTGASADHRLALPYPQVEDAARQLAIALGIDIPPPLQAPVPAHWIEALARDLQDHAGAALVVPGDQQPAAVHALAQAINHKLGAFGSAAVEWMTPVGFDEQARPLADLITAINAGEIDSLVLFDTNPVYTAPADLDFVQALERVPWRLHWGEYLDETARLCQWHIPAAHPLESWGDTRAFDGSTAPLQPLIRPLRGGRSALQFLHALGQDGEEEARKLVRDYWQEEFTQRGEGGDFETFWRTTLRKGLVSGSAATPVEASPRADWRSSLPAPRPAANGLTLQFRPDAALWDGRYANNGWLQEMPRPLTALTWDNALLVSPSLAEREGLEVGSLVRVTSGGRSLTVPVLPLPGQPETALTLHLGYGRAAAGRVGTGVGVSAYRLRMSGNPWAAAATITPSGAEQTLALTQVHDSMEGRDLVRAADLGEYRRNPGFARGHAPEASLYPEPEPAGIGEGRHAWAMAIDLSACIGCNACVTACQAENNIPVVGAQEVSRGRQMHWLRVDRYFAPTALQPRTTFQPVPCMQCENAPCEYVCPVGATLHSGDGLNQMVYPRCVGTRYCSQNCPYKVRRFNWFDFTGEGARYPAPPAVHNPDVTVRARGVMEKCTYCVQRIVGARRQAEGEQRDIAEGELQTACQQACPTQAIVFGDLARPDSEVRRLRGNPLNYAMLEDRNTRPRTTYLAAVHNPNPALQDEDAKD
ncbi:4Fe-4S dicluster domain-containing protein [Microbulbifer yueqingensis]|uniref:Quinol:cytochrome c oxidoreductase iron-sulfur protein n=1 Tax=Microbulbifer yueqingensis TaxID=658219 RepID=A0A1G9BA50_9GAMM|nr:4Fe-4S dicluster domain-containing protein [Microbulbifer yueqingensis]SDK36462.1 quinol:cytochrome c oxidoreductase iron-sulfur protein precursor [Microbulbifer yueqingensis]